MSVPSFQKVSNALVATKMEIVAELIFLGSQGGPGTHPPFQWVLLLWF